MHASLAPNQMVRIRSLGALLSEVFAMIYRRNVSNFARSVAGYACTHLLKYRKTPFCIISGQSSIQNIEFSVIDV